MAKYVTILLLTVMAGPVLFGQQDCLTDQKVYSSLIKSEILSTTKSVTILTRPEWDSSSLWWIRDPIKSKDPQRLAEIIFWTRGADGNRVKSIDSATLNHILLFCEMKEQDAVLRAFPDIPGVKVFPTPVFPIKTASEDGWKRFYKKHPGSGGIFGFSNIYYSPDGKEAVFYHTRHRHGLSAHGALTVLENVNGDWKIKYHIEIWQS